MAFSFSEDSFDEELHGKEKHLALGFGKRKHHHHHYRPSSPQPEETTEMAVEQEPAPSYCKSEDSCPDFMKGMRKFGKKAKCHYKKIPSIIRCLMHLSLMVLIGKIIYDFVMDRVMIQYVCGPKRGEKPNKDKKCKVKHWGNAVPLQRVDEFCKYGDGQFTPVAEEHCKDGAFEYVNEMFAMALQQGYIKMNVPQKTELALPVVVEPTPALPAPVEIPEVIEPMPVFPEGERTLMNEEAAAAALATAAPATSAAPIASSTPKGIPTFQAFMNNMYASRPVVA
jgi:hypothetical protein